MASINENKTFESFPFESLRRLRTTLSPEIADPSPYTAQSYDNRGRISDTAASLQSKLGYFQTRMSSNSFLSETFSWQVKTARTSDSERLLAKSSSTASEKDYSLEVDSLAKTRTAVSDRLVSDDLVDFDTGTYSFSLTIGSDSYSIDLPIVNEPSGIKPTNRSFLRDLERSINNLGLDVTATLKDVQVRDYNPYRENAYKKMSYLSVSATATGDEIDFSLSDTTGSLIEELGLNDIVQFGTQNQYRVDGNQNAEDSNSITVASGEVSAYLLDETETGDNLQIRVLNNRKELSDEITAIIGDYNELISWIDENEFVISQSLKTTLFKELSSLSVQNKTISFNALEEGEIAATSTGFKTNINLDDANSIDTDLSNIGLTLNNDGTIDISEEFANQVKSNLEKVHTALAGDSGFFTKIFDAIDNIQSKHEQSFILSMNSLVSYGTSSGDRQSIYQNQSSSIISFFA